jgi:uncharacterized protein
MKYVKIIKDFPTELLLHLTNFASNCTKTVPNRFHQTIAVPESNGISLALRLTANEERSSRVAFEDLGVLLTKQLCHPLVGYAVRTVASGTRPIANRKSESKEPSLVGGSFAKRSSMLPGVRSNSNHWGIETVHLPQLPVDLGMH